jgi:cytochrome oxidase assembly protein ShyY1
MMVCCAAEPRVCSKIWLKRCRTTRRTAADRESHRIIAYEPDGGFLRKNDAAADRWYSRDVAAIGKTMGLIDPAPYFVDQPDAGKEVSERPGCRFNRYLIS